MRRADGSYRILVYRLSERQENVICLKMLLFGLAAVALEHLVWMSGVLR